MVEAARAASAFLQATRHVDLLTTHGSPICSSPTPHPTLTATTCFPTPPLVSTQPTNGSAPVTSLTQRTERDTATAIAAEDAARDAQLALEAQKLFAQAEQARITTKRENLSTISDLEARQAQTEELDAQVHYSPSLLFFSGQEHTFIFNDSYHRPGDRSEAK